MSINIIALLVSLAMMLTGAGSAGMPAETAKTLTISNISVTFNDEEVRLDPSLRMGVSTDGSKALFDLALEAGGQTLFPIQMQAGEGVLALTAAGQAFGVPGEALNALVEQAGQMVAAAGADAAEGAVSAQVLTFMKDKYMPALVGLVQSVKNPEYVARMKEKVNALYDEMVDRGEGTPDTLELGGTEYAVTRYHYTLDAAQMFALADAVYACDEVLSNYYAAMMELYSMMPEESGLNGVSSLSDFADKMGMEVEMDIDEALSEADDLDAMEAVVTMTVPVQAFEAVEGEEAAAEAEAPELPPMVFNIYSAQIGEEGYAEMSFEYAIEDKGVSMQWGFEQNALGVSGTMDMEITGADEEGNPQALGGFSAEASWTEDEATGDKYLGIDYELEAEDQVEFDLEAEGVRHADGTAEGNVDLSVEAMGISAELEFDLAVTAEAIANAFEGAEITMIEDLSGEGLGALTQDTGFQGRLMQVAGSLMQDAQTLMNDASVQQLVGLFSTAAGADAAAAD